MSQEYELETGSLWQRIFLKSKVNGAPYEEQPVDFKWSWPENTYLQRRLEYLRTDRFPDELWEPGQAAQKDIADAGVVGPDCVLASDGSFETGGTPDNPVHIQIPSDDWTWFADPS